MRLLFCGSGWHTYVGILERSMPPGCRVELWDRKVPLEQAVAGVEVLLPSNGPITASVIAAARELRFIQQPAAGVENIDLDAARARGIPVCNAPGMNQVAVAELALFFMLALLRRIPEASAAFRAGRIGEPIGRELRGRRLGIIGMGRSGQALARLAEAAGMTVDSVGSRRTDSVWEAFLRRASIISIHCPLTPATRGLLDDRAFSLLQPGALLVNCARGAVVDRGALERALENGQLAGAGLDVFWDEPWDPADRLFQRPDVITTPHVGGSTEEGMAGIARIVGDNVGRFLRGEELLHRVA